MRERRNNRVILLSSSQVISGSSFSKASYALIAKYAKRGRNAKNKKCIAIISRHFFSHFAPLFSLLTFCSISRQGRHSWEKSKDFVVYFFAALIKYEICMKCEKYTVSVSYFVVFFAKTLAKYEKCIVGLTEGES